MQRQRTEIYNFGALHDLISEFNADNHPPTFWTGRTIIAN